MTGSATGRECGPDPDDSAQVGSDGGQDVDPAVRVVHPVDRHFVDAQSALLGENQELGVEEPAGVLDERNEPGSDVGADRLEAALGVGEPGTQGSAEQHVVPAGDELPLRAPHDAGAAGESGTDRQVRVPGDQRRDQGKQPREIGGKVNIHVRQNCGIRGRPGSAQRSAASLLLQMDDAHLRKLAGESRCDRSGAVSAGVVGNGDPREVRDVSSEIVVKPPYAMLQVGFLVVDRDDNLEHRHIGARRQPRDR